MTDKPFDTAILHFGLDKTGSTAIQDVCDQARAELASRCSIVYPPGSWHAQLGSCFSSHPARYVLNVENGRTDETAIRAADRRYLQEQSAWIRAQPRARQLLFSYEGFISLNLPDLIALRTHCENFAERVKVLLYVRPPLSYAVSAMSQRVKMGRPAWAPDEERPVYRFKERFKRLASAFGRNALEVRVFTRQALTEGDVVIDFFSALGLDLEQARALSKLQRSANESLSARGLAFGMALREHLAALDIRLSQADFNNRHGSQLNRITGAPIKLSAEQIELIQTEFQPHAEVLRREFGIEFDEAPERFLRADDDQDADATRFANEAALLYMEASLGPQRLECAQGHLVWDTAPTTMRASETVRLPLTLQQQSCHWWRGTPELPLRLCYHWLHEDRQMAHFEGRRTPLPVQVLAPGQRVPAEIEVLAPAEPGRYILQVTGLQEGWCWFEQKGFTPLECPVHVT
ncbi:hypothetical protein KAK07_07030 [Ideonella sp. 4Y16]|uniref:Uncharacterized protein n=1 Tax=Ideonella alba TaxID=2824118 RepID=A0A940Y7J8_9BURK|nr:hypothetical protein [Ideonella alba]MBQ0929138.1 hypothetical protein [Ideonella alba]MBQ0943084.1 hypothetical protein [Ideonella alba]